MSGNVRSLAIILCVALEHWKAVLVEAPTWIPDMMFLLRIFLGHVVRNTDMYTKHEHLSFATHRSYLPPNVATFGSMVGDDDLLPSKRMMRVRKRILLRAAQIAAEPSLDLVW